MFSSSTVLVLVTVAFLVLNQVAGQRVLQTGGNTIQQSTANALNAENGMDLNKREWGRKLENLKSANHLQNDNHAQIWSNGDYGDKNGEIIDNLLNYNHN